ncbi:MAG: type II secretion system minor pseudopilin GspH [Xanthomonadales bacterium]|nr:type II secretion system minor pseudopilin GspH [Xanthomonadales bacterium]
MWRTGIAEYRRITHGFSLIEILIVLVIIAVTTGAVVLSIRGSGEREVENAARRAQALITLACERAELGGRDIGIAAVTDGLRFGYFEIDGWRAFGEEGNDELRARALGKAVALRAWRENVELPLADAEGSEPAFACLSSGELTPFVLRIDRADVERPWELEAHLDGQIDLRQVAREP